MTLLPVAIKVLPSEFASDTRLRLRFEREAKAVSALTHPLQYMAPEQLEGLEADSRTDIFAFGTLLYEMVTAQRTFSGATKASLIATVVERDGVVMRVVARTGDGPVMIH